VLCRISSAFIALTEQIGFVTPYMEILGGVQAGHLPEEFAEQPDCLLLFTRAELADVPVVFCQMAVTVVA